MALALRALSRIRARSCETSPPPAATSAAMARCGSGVFGTRICRAELQSIEPQLSISSRCSYAVVELAVVGVASSRWMSTIIRWRTVATAGGPLAGWLQREVAQNFWQLWLVKFEPHTHCLAPHRSAQLTQAHTAHAAHAARSSLPRTVPARLWQRAPGSLVLDSHCGRHHLQKQRSGQMQDRLQRP